MDELDEIILVLDISVKKNGEMPLTNKHLLNILKMARKNIAFRESLAEAEYPPYDPDYD